MQNNFKAAVTMRLILSVLLIGFIASCENPGSVGGSIIPQPDIVFDTLIVSGFEADSVISSTGNLTYVPIGKYNDQLFGDLEAIGYFKPSIDFDIDTVLNELFDVQFLINVDSSAIYGDTTLTSSFSIYDLTENWRGNELKLGANLSYRESDPITTFDIVNESELYIKMPDSWRDEFAVFYNDTSAARDSLFVNDFFGFAIVQNGGPGKINLINSSSSGFIFINENDRDTTFASLKESGYDLKRNNESRLPQRFTLHNTLERFYRANLSDIADRVSNSVILKAELIFYIDDTSLESTLPVNHNRLAISTLDANFNLNFDKAYELQFLNSEIRGFLDEEKNIFRFNVTNLIENYLYNNNGDDPEIFFSINPAGGFIRSTLLFNEEVSSKEPKLIITTSQAE